MIFGSVCSGIEAASCAWSPLGWRAAFLSEIEAFPRAVLQHHYPEVPLHGAFTTIRAGEYAPIDLLVGGTPCQSFSVAGLRGGRLTPRECERLQGFPDDYTLIPWRKGMAPDGPRYKALGNSMAVPVMAWIGRRIAAVDTIERIEAAA